MTVATELDIRPLSPLIGAEIHGIDLSRPLERAGGGPRCARRSTPTT